MNKIFIAFAALALISTAAIVFVHQTQDAELEKIHIHRPHIHLPHIHLKNVGACIGVVKSAVSSCGAVIDSTGTDISGDIGCVKSILNAKKCGHIL